MNGYSKVILIGNLTKDPELRYTPTGRAVCKFSLAINKTIDTQDGPTQRVCYIDVTTWNRQAETVAEYLIKGSLAMVEGELEMRHWTTTEGLNRYKHEVMGSVVKFLSSKKQAVGAVERGGDLDAGDGIGAKPDTIPF